MEILCPLRAGAEVEPLLRAGARQFYAGVDSAVLFGASAGASPILNCRPWPGSNFESEDEVRAACERVRDSGGCLYVTFNWYDYREWELAAILAFLGRLEALGGVVAVDLTLIGLLRRELPRLRLILGTVAHAQNSGAVAFFRREGVQRFVLPRHLTLDEIRDLVARHPDVAFEAFIKNQDCYFAQGLCYYTHDRVDPELRYGCGRIWRYWPSRDLAPAEVERLDLHLPTLLKSCGACAVQALERAGVAAVKLVGRELPLEEKLRDFTFLRRAIESVECAPEAFGERVQALHRETYGASCKHDCMY